MVCANSISVKFSNQRFACLSKALLPFISKINHAEKSRFENETTVSKPEVQIKAPPFDLVRSQTGLRMYA